MATASTVNVQKSSFPLWLLLVEGIAAIIIGIFLFLRPAATTIILIQFLGIYWLITGIFAIISLIWDRTAWGWKLFSAVLGILAGILIIQNPLWSTLLVPVTLAIVLGSIGIVIGIVQLIDAFSGGGWGMGILGGLSILLGILLVARPVIAGLALPYVLGGLLMVGGILAIAASFGLRSATRKVMESQARAKPMAAPAQVPVTGVAPVQEAAVGITGDISGAAVAGAADIAALGMAAAESMPEDIPPAVDIPAESTPGYAEEAGAGLDDPAASRIAEPVESAPDVGESFSTGALTGNVDPTDLAEVAKFKHSLEFVEGIGPAYAEQLKLIGLDTCLDLLKVGASRQGREDIATGSGIPGTLILKWVNHIDLYRIKGIGPEYADLLEASGVDTVLELAQRNPAHLIEKINTVNLEKARVRQLPTEAQVVDWISQAKGLPRVVTY